MLLIGNKQEVRHILMKKNILYVIRLAELIIIQSWRVINSVRQGRAIIA